MVTKALRVLCVVLAACGGGGAGDDTGLDPDAGGDPDANVAEPALAGLVATAGVFDPPFEPEVGEYDLDLTLAETGVAFTLVAAVPATTIGRGTDTLDAITASRDGGAITNLLSPSFDAAASAYTMDVGLWLERLQLTATTHTPSAGLQIAAQSATSGVALQLLALEVGTTNLAATATSLTTQRTYSIAVTRASAARPWTAQASRSTSISTSAAAAAAG